MLKEVGGSSQCHDYSNVQGAAYFGTALLPLPRRQGLVLPQNSAAACLKDTSDGQQISTIVATCTTKGLVFLNEEMDSIEFSYLVDYLTHFAMLICLGGEVYHIFHGEKLCLPFFFFLNTFASREIGFVRYTCRLVHAT